MVFWRGTHNGEPVYIGSVISIEPVPLLPWDKVSLYRALALGPGKGRDYVEFKVGESPYWVLVCPD